MTSKSTQAGRRPGRGGARAARSTGSSSGPGGSCHVLMPQEVRGPALTLGRPHSTCARIPPASDRAGRYQENLTHLTVPRDKGYDVWVPGMRLTPSGDRAWVHGKVITQGGECAGLYFIFVVRDPPGRARPSRGGAAAARSKDRPAAEASEDKYVTQASEHPNLQRSQRTIYSIEQSRKGNQQQGSPTGLPLPGW